MRSVHHSALYRHSWESLLGSIESGGAEVTEDGLIRVHESRGDLIGIMRFIGGVHAGDEEEYYLYRLSPKMTRECEEAAAIWEPGCGFA